MSNDVLRVLSVMVFWASCYPLITLGIEHAPHITFATLRALIAGCALLGVSLILKKPMPNDTGVWAWLCVAGVGSTTLGYLGMFHAAEFVAPGLATVVANTQPLIAAAIAYFLLQERLNIKALFGMALGFIGVIVVAGPQLFADDSSSTAKGVGYVVLAAVGVSLGNVAIKRLVGNIDASTAMGWQLVIGAIPLAALALLNENTQSVSWHPNFLLSLLGLSLIGTAAAFWLWHTALERMELSRANAFSFLVPFLGLTFGVIFFGETITPLVIGGALLAVLGVRLVVS